MKKIYKSIKLIALLVACLAIPSLAGAQVVKNMYFNVDWQINSPFSQDFSDKTSGWGAHAEAGYYVIPNFSVGAFISYHTNNKYIDRQTLPVGSTSAITSDQQHSIFQLPFGAAFRYNVAPESQFQPYGIFSMRSRGRITHVPTDHRSMCQHFRNGFSTFCHVTYLPPWM